MAPDASTSGPDSAADTRKPPEAPPLPASELGLRTFPELLEWLIGTRYRHWAVSTFHAASRFGPGERPPCALVARVLLSVGDVPGSTRAKPIEATYADALQQLRTRSARRLPEECLQRTLLALQPNDEWKMFLADKAREWDESRGNRTYDKERVEAAIRATLAPAPDETERAGSHLIAAGARPRGRRRVLLPLLAIIAACIVAAVVGYRLTAASVATQEQASSVQERQTAGLGQASDSGGAAGTSGSGSRDALPLEVEVEYRSSDDRVLPVRLREEADGTVRVPKGMSAGAWLTRLGAADIGYTEVKMAVNCRSQDTVVIRGISAQVQRSPPLTGSIVDSVIAGNGSAVTMAWHMTLLSLDLGADQPVAYEGTDTGRIHAKGPLPYFDRHYLTMENGDFHEFVVAGMADTISAEWRIVIDYEVDGQRGRVVVDDSGAPFRTSGRPRPEPDYLLGYFSSPEPASADEGAFSLSSGGSTPWSPDDRPTIIRSD
jgi:hypothetical protein